MRAIIWLLNKAAPTCLLYLPDQRQRQTADYTGTTLTGDPLVGSFDSYGDHVAANSE